MDKPLRYKPYDELYELIEQVDILRDLLNKAKEAETYEELAKCLDDASWRADHISTDICEVEEQNRLTHSDEKDELVVKEEGDEYVDEDDDDNENAVDDEYGRQFVNALNNFIKAHR